MEKTMDKPLRKYKGRDWWAVELKHRVTGRWYQVRHKDDTPMLCHTARDAASRARGNELGVDWRIRRVRLARY